MALRFPAVLVVADRSFMASDERWLAAVAEVGEAAVGHPVLLQVRAHDATPAAFHKLAQRARNAVPAGVPLFLNGDVRLAAELGYDGVHWPQRLIPEQVDEPHAVRWRSAAIHDCESARRARRAGADLLVFGSVFTPGSKVGVATGAHALTAVTRSVDLPVIAIGGVSPGRVGTCIAAGASGVAVVSGILGATSHAGALRTYLAALSSGSGCDDAC